MRSRTEHNINIKDELKNLLNKYKVTEDQEGFSNSLDDLKIRNKLKNFINELIILEIRSGSDQKDYDDFNGLVKNNYKKLIHKSELRLPPLRYPLFFLILVILTIIIMFLLLLYLLFYKKEVLPFFLHFNVFTLSIIITLFIYFGIWKILGLSKFRKFEIKNSKDDIVEEIYDLNHKDLIFNEYDKIKLIINKIFNK